MEKNVVVVNVIFDCETNAGLHLLFEYIANLRLNFDLANYSHVFISYLIIQEE